MMELLPGEIARPIEGYEGLYSVTSFGRVISHERIIVRSDGKLRLVKEKFLKPRNDKYGYRRLNLRRDTRMRSVRLHRLVANAFIANPHNLPEINHKDGNKHNNHCDNLEWVTHRMNIHHALANGLTKKRTSKCYGVRLLDGKYWVSYVSSGKHDYTHIGCYKTELEAAIAYDLYVRDHKLDKLLNFP